MPQRYENGTLKYTVKTNQQGIQIKFKDLFSIKYLAKIKFADLLDESLQERYQIAQSKQTVKLILKNSDNSQLLNHDDLFSIIQEDYLKIDYYYLKKSKFQSQSQQEIQSKLKTRNNKIKRILQKNLLKKIYPQIKAFIYFQQKTDSFEKGQILVYISSDKKKSFKQIIKFIDSYDEQTVIYGLDEYFDKKSIEKGEFCNQQIKQIIDKMVCYLDKEFKQAALNTKLVIQDISSYVPFNKKQSYPGCQDKFGIKFVIEGMFQSLPQFYFNLASIFLKNPVILIRMDDIEFTGSMKQTQQRLFKQQEMVIFFGSQQTAAVMDYQNRYSKQPHELKKLLRTGVYKISCQNGFTLQQISELIKQHRQIQRFMNGQRYTSFLQFKFQEIDQKSFYIRCERVNFKKFIHRAFDYFDQNKKVQIKRKQFVTEFQIYMFMNLVKSLIQKNYPTLSFSVKDGQLYSYSKQGDVNSINAQIQSQKTKLIKQIVKIPTRKRIINHASYQITQNKQFCKQITIRTTLYKFNQTINVFVKSINSLRSVKRNMIAIVDSNYIQCDFFMQNIEINQYQYEQRFKKLCRHDPKQSRRMQYMTKKSKYVQIMQFWFVQYFDEYSFSKFGRDLQQFVLQIVNNQNQSQINLVIPYHFQKDKLKDFLSPLFFQLNKSFNRLKIKEINIYYETQNFQQITLDTNQCFLRQNRDYFKLHTKLYLTQVEIQKIVLMEYYSVNYWNQKLKCNQRLSPLNSFIFNYQKTKKKQQFKVPLFLKCGESVQSEYLLCLKQKTYYKISKYCRIQKFQLQKNKTIQKFANLIKHYFNYSQYLVVYMDKEQKQIEKDLFYIWIKANNQVPPQKIKKVQISSQEKLIPKKDSQVVINVKKTQFKDTFVIQTHQKFTESVKKAIFVQN